VTLSKPGVDVLGTSIRHLNPGQSVTWPELLLDALGPSTFYDMNCRVGRGDFNGSKFFEKVEGLSPKMRLEILLRRAAPVPHLPAPFPARISSC